MSFNKITLVGNLGQDPELRYTPSGTAVCNFSLATNEKRKDKTGEMQDFTTWFKITLWGGRAETATKYLTKGKQVYIEGRITVSEWLNRDNEKQFTLEVNGTDMQFLSNGLDNRTEKQASQGKTRNTDVEVPRDDDIPF